MATPCSPLGPQILTDADFERLRVLRARKESEGVRGKKRQLDSYVLCVFVWFCLSVASL
jgi:hypothetical protein